VLYLFAAALLLQGLTLNSMRRPVMRSRANRVAFQGEVWTDGRGYATVRLPAEAGTLEPPVEYELRDLEPAGGRITAALEQGRFTIATDQPHVKVAWRISGRRRSQPADTRYREEKADE